MPSIEILNSVPLFPAVNLKETIAFYNDLGFANVYKGKERAKAYAVMNNGIFEFHLYTYKKLPVPTPTNSHLFEVNDVDAIYNLFMDHYKAAHGKVPARTGLSRVSIPKTLTHDRRFTVTDPNGNYLIFVQTDIHSNLEATTKLEQVYQRSHTLAYSRESPREAVAVLDHALTQVDLSEESPELLFLAYVLLMDNYQVLENFAASENYYQLATELYDSLEGIDSEYLDDAIETYENY